MTRLLEICVLIVVVQLCEVTPKPLFEGFNIERKINIDFKPLKFKPLTFIREKWGPFGKIVRKHTIERRDLDEMTLAEDIKPIGAERTIPVIERIEEPITIPLSTYRPPPNVIVPLTSDPIPSSVLNTDISPSIPGNPYFISGGILNPSLNSIEGSGPRPVVEVNPIEGPLFVPAPPPSVSSPPPPPPPVPSPSPPPVPTPPAEVGVNSRGGLISFFGEILSEIMTRIITRARASFSQLSISNQGA